MKSGKQKDKVPSGSLKIDPSVLIEAKIFCTNNGILISYFATAALKEKLQKEKQK